MNGRVKGFSCAKPYLKYFFNRGISTPRQYHKLLTKYRIRLSSKLQLAIFGSLFCFQEFRPVNRLVFNINIAEQTNGGRAIDTIAIVLLAELKYLKNSRVHVCTLLEGDI